MGHETLRKGSYDPEVLSILFQAFDEAWRIVAPAFAARPDETEQARRRLAELLMRHAEEGERDPSRLAENAVAAMKSHGQSQP